jgi:hypothetical protein
VNLPATKFLQVKLESLEATANTQR